MLPRFGSAAFPRGAANVKTFDGLGDLIRLASEVKAEFERRDRARDGDKRKRPARYFFRGECAFFPTCSGGIFRDGGFVENEKKIFQDAQNRVPELFRDCRTTFEKLCHMQHYGFPTRLIDISSDLATAWFMATDSWSEDFVAKHASLGARGTYAVPNVMLLRVPQEREKFTDSDLVSMLSCVARMNSEFDLWNWRHEVRQERDSFGNNERFFKDRIIRDACKNWAVFPRLSNPRVRRQNGAFVLCGLTLGNCRLLSAGRRADKTKPDGGGFFMPEIPWKSAPAGEEEICVCARFAPSDKFFGEVSRAVGAWAGMHRDAERVREAARNFRRRAFGELSLVGAGESDIYPDDYLRHKDACREFFSEAENV